MPSAQLLTEALCRLSEVTVSLSGAPSAKGGSSNAPSTQGYPFLSQRGSPQSACVKPWTRKMEWRGVIACLHTSRKLAKDGCGLRRRSSLPSRPWCLSVQMHLLPWTTCTTLVPAGMWRVTLCWCRIQHWTSALASCSRRCHAGGPGPRRAGTAATEPASVSTLSFYSPAPWETVCGRWWWNVECQMWPLL